jgi:hypothetical protein
MYTLKYNIHSVSSTMQTIKFKWLSVDLSAQYIVK